MLWFAAAPAAAQPAKGSVTTSLDNGFARLVFLLDSDVTSQVKVANNVIVISFDQPVNVSVDKLAASSGGYIGAARRDPDGRAIRIALARKVTVNSMAVAERLFVDLLPDSWTGLPPGLPREVIEELARRAHEADKTRQQERPADRRKSAPIRVRFARQPTFTRYTFELPEAVGVAADSRKDKLILTFNALLNFDLGDVNAALPPAIQSIETEFDQDTAVVRFNFSGKVDIRTFREDKAYMVDIEPAEARNGNARDRGAKPSDALAALATEVMARKTAPPADLEPPQSVPAQATRAPAVAEKSPPAPSRAPPTAPERNAPSAPAPATEPVRAQAPSPQPAPCAGEASCEAPPAPASRSSINQWRAARPSAPALQSASSQPSNPDARAPDARVADAGVADARVAEARAAPVVPAMAADGSTTVNVLATVQGETLSLRFPFAGETPAAVFRRADTLWLVFDTNSEIKLAELKSIPGRALRNATATRQSGVSVVRLQLDRPKLTSVEMDGTAWIVSIGSQVTETTHPLGISRSGADELSRRALTIPIDDPRGLHMLKDPEVGDTLMVVTAVAPARGFVNSQDFVELRLLASSQGIVVLPLADDLQAELAPDKVTLTRPSGLSLSMSALGSGHSTLRDRGNVLDAQLWSVDRNEKFGERESELMFAAAKSLESQRLAARVELARFYLAWDMSAEAKGVLDVALKDNPPSAADPMPLVLRALANIMLERPQEALKDLASPVVGNLFGAPLWRALAYAKLGRWNDAHDGFRNLDSVIAGLPPRLQQEVMQQLIRAAIEVGDITGAVEGTHQFEAMGIPPGLEPAMAVLGGEIAEQQGHIGDAVQSYRTAADSWDRMASAQGRLREINLQQSLGKLKRDDAIDSLETLTTIWRGDETEIEALKLLSHLYTEDGRYRDSFHVTRTALTAHPNSIMTRAIQDEAAQTFENLFLAGRGDALSAIDALALFYDFRDLTPIGRRGDEMIRRLADRLVAVDLLDQASDLLQYQVDHRLEGAARSQVATRLAVIYLMNRKPDKAFATLRATRVEDLNNELRQQRLLIEARALSELGRHDVALEIIANLRGREPIKLRADILWAAHRWREAAEQIEILYGDRWKDFAPLNDVDQADILRAAAGYALGEDSLGLARFRERYVGKMGESGASRRAFDVITAPVESAGADFRAVAHAVAAVDTLDGFLRDLRTRYPDAGSLPPDTRKPTTTGTTPAPLGRTAAR